MDKFTKQSEKRYIKNTNDAQVAQLGHLNYMVENVTTRDIFDITSFGTSLADTNSYLKYGINVIKNPTVTNYTVRLPQIPKEGKEVIVVNSSGISIVVYPSMDGGTINGILNGSFTVPSDSKAYTFICYENPAPGSWSTLITQAAGQYDSGVITGNIVGAGFATDVLSSSDPARVYQGTSFYSSTGWAVNGLNQPLFLINPTNGANSAYVAFKPSTPWSFITKVTVYTNMTNDTNQAFGLTYGACFNYYTTGTTNYLGFTDLSGGNFGTANFGAADSLLAGTPVATPLTPNPGDPGTRWGELIYSVQPYQIGDTFIQNANFGAPINSVADQWRTCYINFCFQPRVALTGIKFRFIIDYI